MVLSVKQAKLKELGIPESDWGRYDRNGNVLQKYKPVGVRTPAVTPATKIKAAGPKEVKPRKSKQKDPVQSDYVRPASRTEELLVEISEKMDHLIGLQNGKQRIS